jgi:hypothetical protein
VISFLTVFCFVIPTVFKQVAKFVHFILQISPFFSPTSNHTRKDRSRKRRIDKGTGVCYGDVTNPARLDCSASCFFGFARQSAKNAALPRFTQTRNTGLSLSPAENVERRGSSVEIRQTHNTSLSLTLTLSPRERGHNLQPC